MSDLVTVESIVRKIVYLRGEKVLLDRDLAELYGVETRSLNQAVKRNMARFPADFMFALTREEIMRISQIVTSSRINHHYARDFRTICGTTGDSEIGDFRIWSGFVDFGPAAFLHTPC